MAIRLPIARSEAVRVADAAEPARLRVGDLAQQTNKTVRALHLYEELGLLEPSERSKGGYRLYGGDAALRVRWISKLQDLGFSLPEIRELLHQWEASGSAADAMHRMRALYAQKLEETRAQVARLSALANELEHSVAYLDTCETCEPERLISACPRCELHDCDQPDLVAGLHHRGAASSREQA